ncbi:MAG: AI-2E family transporter [Candidatus Pacebacteria bacterium]|nr:AI-2E family transporter [Candidatus Paceibacterota bacterium]
MRFDYIQQFFFFGLLLATTVTFFWMLGSYLMPVFWAIVIAIVFYPLYLWFERKTHGRSSLASIITIGAVILTVMIPLLVVGGMIVQESIGPYQNISQNYEQIEGLNLLDRTEQFIAFLEPYGISQGAVVEKLREWGTGVSKFLASSLVTIGQMTFSLVISTAIMLYLLFFFFRDGVKLQKTLIYYLPLGDAYEKRLFARFVETSRAVVKGTLAIAALQGLLGGLAFWIVGVSNPALWGVAMALLAILPAIGPAIIWFPASIILLATGSIWEGVTLLVVGILLVSLVDEFLRPILVGRGSKMPDSVTLLATIGGLTTFGVSGFVVGPIIAAFFLSLWLMFGERYQKELLKN